MRSGLVQPKDSITSRGNGGFLRLSTLDTLLGHYNFCNPETAAKILFDRAANDGASIPVFLCGITRRTHDVRLENLQRLAMIIDHRVSLFQSFLLACIAFFSFCGMVLRIERLISCPEDRRVCSLMNTWEGLSTALVRSLELSRDPDQEVLDDPLYDEWHLRDMTEKIGLTFLEQLGTSLPRCSSRP